VVVEMASAGRSATGTTGTPPSNRWRRSRNHESPVSIGKRSRLEPIQIQQRIHQSDDPARGFVKGQPTGNCDVLMAVEKGSPKAEAIAQAINSSRLREDIMCAALRMD
jgi:hypothetical protein